MSSVMGYLASSREGPDEGNDERLDFVNPTTSDLSLPGDGETFLKAAVSLKDQVLYYVVCIYVRARIFNSLKRTSISWLLFFFGGWWWGETGGEGHVGRRTELRHVLGSDCVYWSARHGFHVLQVVRGHRKPTGLATVRGDRRQVRGCRTCVRQVMSLRVLFGQLNSLRSYYYVGTAIDE
jgi:hypothetical protein